MNSKIKDFICNLKTAFKDAFGKRKHSNPEQCPTYFDGCHCHELSKLEMAKMWNDDLLESGGEEFKFMHGSEYECPTWDSGCQCWRLSRRELAEMLLAEKTMNIISCPNIPPPPPPPPPTRKLKINF